MSFTFFFLHFLNHREFFKKFSPYLYGEVQSPVSKAKKARVIQFFTQKSIELGINATPWCSCSKDDLCICEFQNENFCEVFFVGLEKKRRFIIRVKLIAYQALSGPQLLGNEKSTIYLFVDFIKFLQVQKKPGVLLFG